MSKEPLSDEFSAPPHHPADGELDKLASVPLFNRFFKIDRGCLPAPRQEVRVIRAFGCLRLLVHARRCDEAFDFVSYQVW